MFGVLQYPVNYICMLPFDRRELHALHIEIIFVLNTFNGMLVADKVILAWETTLRDFKLPVCSSIRVIPKSVYCRYTSSLREICFPDL